MYTSLDSKHCYYYLGSRFYSPLLSRFMNADSMADTGTGVVGTNMFAYCNNSPIVLVDPDGKKPFSISKIMKRVVSLLSAIIEFVYRLKKNIVMIVYNRPEHDFCDQADWMHKNNYSNSKVIKNNVITKDDFADFYGLGYKTVYYYSISKMNRDSMYSVREF